MLNGRGADERRDRLLDGVPTRDGYDRDGYPPAFVRGKGEGLERGRSLRGWKATSGTSKLGESLAWSLTRKPARGVCTGTRLRYVFR